MQTNINRINQRNVKYLYSERQVLLTIDLFFECILMGNKINAKMFVDDK